MQTLQTNKTTKWPFKDFIKVLLGFFSINIILLILTIIHQKYGTFEFLITQNQSLNGILLYILTVTTFILPLWFFLIRNKNVSPIDFGLRKISIKQAIRTIFIAYGLLLALTAFFIIIKIYVSDIPGLNPQESVLPIFGEGRAAIIIASVIAIGIAPIIEEIFFRGFLLNSLMSKFSFFTSTIITSAIFAFVHFQFESILAIFILSLIINFLYKINNNSTTATIIFHMTNNTVAMIALTHLDKIPQLQ